MSGIGETKKTIVIIVVAVVAAVMHGIYYTHHLRQWSLPAAHINRPVAVIGYVTSIPKADRLASHFNFLMTRFAGQSVNVLVRLSWYGHYPNLSVGDAWQFTAKLKPPHGLHNFGGRYFERWAFVHAVRATGYVVNKKSYHLLAHHTWRYPIDHIRQSLLHVIQRSGANPQLAAILAALTLGSRSLMASWQWHIFQNTGTSHLIAISGLHVGLVATVFYFLASWLWRRFPRRLLRIPAPKAAAVAAILSALFYGFLAGYSLPTQRAVIMVALLMLGNLCHRLVPMWWRLVLAFLLVLVVQPFALFSPSFYLSFMAVVAIAYGMFSYQQGSHWQQWWRLQWLVFIALLPITFYFFQQASLIGPLTNLVAIPWITFFVVPLCLLSALCSWLSVTLGHYLFTLSSYVLWPLWWCLHYFAGWSHTVWHHVLSSPYILFTLLVATALWLAPSDWPGRYLAVMWALPLFFPLVVHPQPKAVWLTVLDVGQGLAAVVQTEHHVLLYDAGPKFPGGFNAGSDVVLPYLRFAGMSQLDLMMISHGDNDHIGGAKAVLAGTAVDQILTSVPRRFAGYPVQTCQAGQHWHWDGVSFTVLAPAIARAYEGNNSSCVLRVQAGQHTVLLTGDIERPQERWLLKHQRAQLAATVLVAPHHGSASSSSPPFVNAVHPDTVLFSLGYYNRYRFPRAVVVRRYDRAGAVLMTTADQGAICLQLSPDGRMAMQFAYQPHFWQK